MHCTQKSHHQALARGLEQAHNLQPFGRQVIQMLLCTAMCLGPGNRRCYPGTRVLGCTETAGVAYSVLQVEIPFQKNQLQAGKTLQFLARQHGSACICRGVLGICEAGVKGNSMVATPPNSCTDMDMEAFLIHI